MEKKIKLLINYNNTASNTAACCGYVPTILSFEFNNRLFPKLTSSASINLNFKKKLTFSDWCKIMI
jgi:hypothetical protein